MQMRAGGSWKEAGAGIAGYPRSSQGLGRECGSAHPIPPCPGVSQGTYSPQSTAPPRPTAAHPRPTLGTLSPCGVLLFQTGGNLILPFLSC